MIDVRHATRPWTLFEAISVAVFLAVLVTATTVLASDSSYRRVVRQLQARFGATEQSLYGAGILGGLTVALVRPAGVSSVSFTILRDLDARAGRSDDFNRVVKSAVDSKWRPLVMYSAPALGQWTHVYSHPDGSHISLLIVNRDHAQAVVAEVSIDPEKLIAFINDPRILGIPIDAGSHQAER